MSVNVQDLDAVRELVWLYVEGSNGDVAKLERAFHPDARIAGHVGSEVENNVPIAEYFAFVASKPGLAGPGARSLLRTIDVCGDAGVAVLVQTDYMGCDFVDYLSVARIEGRWQITNKTYAHTGGAPPEDVPEPPRP
jgi:putative lumazine-binding protein